MSKLPRPNVGDLFKHYKGAVYRILPYSKDASNQHFLGELVFYEDVNTGEKYHRTLEEFVALTLEKDPPNPDVWVQGFYAPEAEFINCVPRFRRIESV